ALQPVEHVLDVPLLGALVLQPLVVRDDDAARVAQDVGDDVDALAEQDILGLGIGRAVRALDDHLDLERLGLRNAELELEGGGHEDVGVEREELGALDLLCALVAGDRAGLADVLAELVRVDALGVGDVAAGVADADDHGALLRQEARGVAADVAEALDDDVAAVEVEVAVPGPLGDAVDDALAGGLGAAVATAGGDALAGDDAAHGVAIAGADDVHVRVHHPDHGLAVGVHVGRRDVVLGADVGAQRRGEPPRDPLELELAVLANIDLDAALAAAER